MGDDTIDGGDGDDYLDGGAGINTVSFASSTNGVKVNLDSEVRHTVAAGSALEMG
jgi:Ca2+-binding RTX toxin-like protein